MKLEDFKKEPLHIQRDFSSWVFGLTPEETYREFEFNEKIKDWPFETAFNQWIEFLRMKRAELLEIILRYAE